MDDEINKANTIVLIVGIYKSGTSLITQLVGKMGFDNLGNLWDDYVEGVENRYLTNESKSVNKLNDTIIRSYLGRLDKLPPVIVYKFLNNFLSVSGLYKDQIEKTIKPQLNHGLIIKDPRFCITLPIWLSSLERFSTVKIIWVIRDRSKVVKSWMKDSWCRSMLNLKSEIVAFKLAAKYESYFLKQYLDYSTKYKSLVVEFESLKREPLSNVRLLADFLNKKMDYAEISKMIKK
jgi:hypothetical protein